MATLIRKEIGDYHGGVCYYAVFDGEPTTEDIERVRQVPIEHECFSGIVEIPFEERVKDETLREGFFKVWIGQAT